MLIDIMEENLSNRLDELMLKRFSKFPEARSL